jgi:hypothetical protein
MDYSLIMISETILTKMKTRKRRPKNKILSQPHQIMISSKRSRNNRSQTIKLKKRRIRRKKSMSSS